MLARMDAPAKNEIQVTLPDGSTRELTTGATGLDLARSIGEGLARAAVAVQVNDGPTQDLRLELRDGDRVRIITSRDEDALAVLRHSAAHVLAEAICATFPGTQLAYGPPVDGTCGPAQRSSQSGPGVPGV